MKLLDTAFKKNVLTLMTGSAIAQGLLIISTPILTRLFQPEDFGIAAIFGALSGIIGIISVYRYELAILLPKKDNELYNLIFAVHIILVVNIIVVFILIFFFKPLLLHYTWFKQLKSWVWLIPINIFFIGFYNIYNYYANRVTSFKKIATSRVVNSLTKSSGQVFLGILGLNSAFGLILGNILSNISGALYIGSGYFSIVYSNIKLHYNKKQLFKVLKKYKKFPLFDSWTALINSISLMAVPILLSFFFSAKTVGLYVLSEKMISLPLGYLSASMRQVYYQKAVEENNLYGTPLRIFKKTAFTLFKISIIPGIALFFSGKYLFAVIFGEEWVIAGIFMQILSPVFFIRAVVSPISSTFLVLGKQHINLVLNIIIAVSIFISIVIGGLNNNIFMAVSLLSIFSFFAYLIYFLTINYQCNKKL